MSGDEEYRRLVERISAEKGLSIDDVEKMVEARIEEFDGIINRDAAALMVAKSLGVDVEPSATDVVHSLNLGDLVPGFQGIDVKGIVIERMPPRQSSRGKLFARLVIADETAAVPVIGWGEPAGKLGGVELGDIIVASRVSVRKRGEGVEIFLLDRSSVKSEGKVEAGVLWSLARRYTARTIVMECAAACCRGETCCLYGVTPTGEPVQLNIPEAIDTTMYEGRVVAASRVSWRSGDVIYARLYRGGVIDILGEASGIGKDSLSVFESGGVVVGYIVFKERGGRVYLASGNAVTPLAVFDDDLLLEFTGLLGSEVAVLGVKRSMRGNVLSDCASIKVLSSNPPHFTEARLLGSEGWVEVEATLLDASLYYRCLGGRAIASMRCLLDDGTGRVRGVVSGIENVAAVLGLGADDLCGYENVGPIIEYSVDEARGRDYRFRGFLDRYGGVLYAVEVVGG